MNDENKNVQTDVVKGGEKKKKKPNRIGNAETLLLVLVAILFDVFSLIPFINIAVVFISQSLMALFFLMHGVNIMSKKRAIPYVLAWIIEFIPAISVLPAITLETIIIIVMVRLEDKTGISTTPGKSIPLAKK